jgi:hypothetical protein
LFGGSLVIWRGGLCWCRFGGHCFVCAAADSIAVSVVRREWKGRCSPRSYEEVTTVCFVPEALADGHASWHFSSWPRLAYLRDPDVLARLMPASAMWDEIIIRQASRRFPGVRSSDSII